ncbi:MAG: protein kinase, partial [Acidobacteria bacterium]|nr:protein kinase [Acidobacteriota bacterium]
MKHCPKCRIYYPNAQTFCNEDGAMLSLKDQYGLNGRIINDKYLIEALIGIGGMSAVYCAQQFGVVRRVAFKVLLPHLAANNDKMVSFFEREARTAGRLLHENIATVFDAGRTEDELAYIVMEWLDGVTLEEELRKNGVFALERVATLLKQIASALDTAHTQKVIHRDLKPSNIMLIHRADGEEQVKVLDFGLAKLATEACDLVSHAVGTPHYASPEQFQLGSEIDARTDIYSLGVMLYQLLSGRLPFSSPSIHEVIRLHMLEMPRPIRELRPEVPPGVEELLQRMMAKTPHYRPQSVREVAQLFDHAWQGYQQHLQATTTTPTRVDADFLNDISLVDGLMRSEINPPTIQRLRHTGDLHAAPVVRPAVTHGAFASAAAPAPAPPSPVPVFAPTPTPVATETHSPRPQFTAQAGTSPLPVFTVSYSTNHAPHTQPAVSLNNSQGGSSVAETANAATSQFSPSGFLSLSVSQTWFTKLAAYRHQKPVWLAGLALAALALVAGYRLYRPAVTMAETDTILIADFANSTRDEVFDGALRQALTIQLAQTPYLNQLPDEKVRETLKYMGRQPHEKLTREVAREICQRQGVKALIVGSIDKLDRHYALTLEALNAQTGEVLARALEEPPNKDNVLKSLDRATIELREALGESLSSIKKFNKPTEYATTFSLDALKAYTSGREANTFKGNPADALAQYKRAIELDPSFALAYIGQASIYANQGQPELSAQAAERAFALRERVSEQEKITINTLYYLAVSGEVDEAINTFKLARQTYPRTISPPINLSVCYGRLGQFEEALRLATEANQLDPRNSIPYSNRAELLVRLGRNDEAREVLDQAFGQKLDRGSYHALLYQLAFLKGDTSLMRQQTDWASGKPDEFRAYEWQAQAAAAQGKMRAASEFIRRSNELGMQRNLKEAVAAIRVTAATHGLLTGLSDPYAHELRELFDASPNLFTRFTIGTVAPYATVALALSGQTETAQKIVDETVQRQPRNTLAQNLWLPTVRAALALKKNNPAAALEALQATQPYESAGMFYPTWLRGQAY